MAVLGVVVVADGATLEAFGVDGEVVDAFEGGFGGVGGGCAGVTADAGNPRTTFSSSDGNAIGSSRSASASSSSGGRNDIRTLPARRTKQAVAGTPCSKIAAPLSKDLIQAR